ncbi:hypothetical protein GQ43DRAFT_441034 [Delitschia confertaspora ATCC 74209]|uniref:ELYS-like domain-containing protein n=1 Tax=Delitschia confertaspora ATCC 74209 TaxID=1513339 RepID=A0A9P4JMJ2_9PLEO|nr:hypothetical protein GQ43DRAFT_441034 [Delitschia confertaspora ATCC 74209]
MLDIEDFEAVFKKRPNEHPGFPAAVQEEIARHRLRLGGKLFFDRLCELLQLDIGRLYPPHSNKQIRALHSLITTSALPLHNKHCLLFYILKDLSPSTHTDADIATAFAAAVHLPTRYWTFLEGLWALDALNWETAVGFLTHPSIIPTFPDEIMSALLEFMEKGKMEGEMMEDGLPMAYYSATRPPLVREGVREAFVRYMTRRSVTETFYWIRARPDYEQRQLFEVMVLQTLERNGVTGLEERADMVQELVGLPFNDDEEQWFEDFLVEGLGRNCPGARDTVMVRRITTGRLREAVHDSGLRGKKLIDLDWDVLKDGLRRGLGPRVEVETPFVVS